MGMGLRGRRGAGRGRRHARPGFRRRHAGPRFRRRRPFGIGRRRRRWGRRRNAGQGFALPFWCCAGGAKAVKHIQSGLIDLEQEQKEILELQTTAQPEENTERVKELQNEQVELLNDIMELQAKEQDPEKLQILIDQQIRLIANMQQMQTAGYQYQNAIPKPGNQSQMQAGSYQFQVPQPTQTANQQQVPMEASTYF